MLISPIIVLILFKIEFSLLLFFFIVTILINLIRYNFLMIFEFFPRVWFLNKLLSLRIIYIFVLQFIKANLRFEFSLIFIFIFYHIRIKCFVIIIKIDCLSCECRLIFTQYILAMFLWITFTIIYVW